MLKEGTRRAVFDIGSSSVLLLVAEYRGGTWQRVIERCEVTQLGEGLADSASIAEPALARTEAACERLLQEALSCEPDSVKAVGTMALRIAANAPDMLRRLARIGLNVRVLQPKEEARLSYLSVSRDPTFRGQVDTVIDIGGASTEICTETGEFSYAMGAAMLSSGLLGTGPCPATLVQAACEAADLLFRDEPPDQSSAVAAVGSTGVNLASILRGLDFDADAVHGSVLTLKQVRELRERLCSMGVAERADMPGLQPNRAVAIHAGALILERAMIALGTSDVRVSSRGLRWALLDTEIT